MGDRAKGCMSHKVCERLRQTNSTAVGGWLTCGCNRPRRKQHVGQEKEGNDACCKPAPTCRVPSLRLRLSNESQYAVAWSRADWRASAPAEAASSAAESELMYLHNIKSQTVTQLTVSDNQQGARRHRGMGADAWSRADCLASAPAEAASSAADGVDVPGQGCVWQEGQGR